MPPSAPLRCRFAEHLLRPYRLSQSSLLCISNLSRFPFRSSLDCAGPPILGVCNVDGIFLQSKRQGLRVGGCPEFTDPGFVRQSGGKRRRTIGSRRSVGTSMHTPDALLALGKDRCRLQAPENATFSGGQCTHGSQVLGAQALGLEIGRLSRLLVVLFVALRSGPTCSESSIE